MRDVKLDDVATFITVARLGSFGLAAEELHITQSALSRRIKKLEEALGAPLLDRTTRSVSVSTLGYEFLPRAIRLVEDFDRSLDDISKIITVRKGTITLSCNMTISDTLLPDIIHTFKQLYPEIRVRVHENSSPRALEEVLSGRSEMALAQFGDGHPDLEFEILINDHFVVTCHNRHRLASYPALTWQDILNEQFILLRSGSGTSKLLKKHLGPHYDLLSKDIEVGHFHAQLGLVGRGVGIAVIPSLIHQSGKNPDLVTIPLSNPAINRKLGIVTYRGRSLSPAAVKFREIARSVMTQHYTATQGTTHDL